MKHGAEVHDIGAMLEGAEAPVSEKCCIYRVPFRIRKLNEDAYTPMVVSVGPFHHNAHPGLHNMEKHKLLYCKAFLQRTKTTIDTWIHYLEEELSFIRSCYSETIDLVSKDELVKIILVDSFFILELFCRFAEGEPLRNDVCLTKTWLFTHIQLDLLLLENQLPFSLLDALFNMSFSRSEGLPSFLQLTFEYFNDYNRSNMNSDNISISNFTDLLRTFNLKHPLHEQPHRIQEFVKHFPSATELSEAGVRFKVNTEKKCLLDFKFAGGDLEIPQLEVHDWTELLFRNMVALEQCHYPEESYITDYVKILDVLVNTSKDVDVLIRKRVLVNWLGDSDIVAKLFNGLMQNVTESNVSSHFLSLRQELNDFYRNPWNNLKSTLKRDYCRTPWQTAATVAAIVLLILSFVQAVCSVLQVLPH
ncbi:unnamed protein product [Sphenostylis stenocarpa]|uniref:Uncharacterized protein n=1 Tax=Sphenostylis stenocarpa TaxID=92480 RepID=A0AA86W0H9_9FABA|nr:unnamed protein product [Sphenostylis stenocarpa]